MTKTPAALMAEALGDLENAKVASSPGGIERQEAMGQAELVASANMPKEMAPSREAFEAVGFTFGDEVDDLFVSATLPQGWSRAATDESRHSVIVDEQGRRRVAIFYKAAFYDRDASATLLSRYKIDTIIPEGPDRDTLVATVIMDAEMEIHRVGECKYLGDFKRQDALYASAAEWLDANRPGWRDPVTSWNA